MLVCTAIFILACVASYLIGVYCQKAICKNEVLSKITKCSCSSTKIIVPVFISSDKKPKDPILYAKQTALESINLQLAARLELLTAVKGEPTEDGEMYVVTLSACNPSSVSLDQP